MEKPGETERRGTTAAGQSPGGRFRVSAWCRLLLALACLVPVGGCAANSVLAKSVSRLESPELAEAEAAPTAPAPAAEENYWNTLVFGDEEYTTITAPTADEFLAMRPPAGHKTGTTTMKTAFTPASDKPAARDDSLRSTEAVRPPAKKASAPVQPIDSETVKTSSASAPDARGKSDTSTKKAASAPDAKGKSDASAKKPAKEEKSPEPPPRVPGLADDLVCGMIAVNPDEFEKETREVPLALRHVAASVLRGNRSIQVAAFRPQQAEADILSAKSVYDPEAFASWSHSRTDASAAMIISGIPSRNREFRNETGRAGIRQRTPTGATVSAYRQWDSGIERNPGSSCDYGHGAAYVAEITQPILNGFADMENRTILQISRLQVDVTQEEFRQTVLETMSKALEAYWTVIQYREELRINKESLDMAERLLEREIGRKGEGISTQLDVHRAREAVATRAYNVYQTREQYHQAQENLKYYLNDKSVPVGMDVYVDAVESLDTPLVKARVDKSIDAALENRPEMRNADLAIRTSEARHRYAKHTLLPELNLVGQVRHNDKDNDVPTANSSTTYIGTDWTVGVEFSMPIGNMKGRSNLRKAEAEMSQVVEEKRNARDIIVTEVRTIVKSMDMVVREIPLNKRAMSSAEKVLEGEWARLELNQTGNRDLLQAQDLLAVTEKNYIGSLVRYNIYIVRLFAAEGTLLDKMGITLDS